MSWWYEKVLRPALFARDSEEIHNVTVGVLGRVSKSKVLFEFLEDTFGSPAMPVELFGLKFPNPIGLAAGMDKHAAALPAWRALGFGFCELGGVTWHAQEGNPRPRMFRATTSEALVNRMGFNNPGADAMASKLDGWRAAGRWPAHPVGINLGKSKVTPLVDAAADYVNSFRALRNHADFFVVNVSSPNTPGLRQLQDKVALDEILAALQENNHDGAASAKPILVKVAPDLEFRALDEIIEVANARRIAGFVATNTTITRPTTSDAELARVYGEAGGLSGRPLRQQSTAIIRHLYKAGSLPILGVGGVFGASDAWEKITAGASLIQLYTGLVYRGPSIARAIVKGLARKLQDAGLKNVKEAVGVAAISC